uniref:Uncharacterized protein n=1 Tax=Coprothermobacter proteolyticus (strain ATCC 35245 / DSM 5265 / OCM 4 / BT) TaxID=309798 RepID=B5Y6E2_COPPD
MVFVHYTNLKLVLVKNMKNIYIFPQNMIKYVKFRPFYIICNLLRGGHVQR